MDKTIRELIHDMINKTFIVHEKFRRFRKGEQTIDDVQEAIFQSQKQIKILRSAYKKEYLDFEKLCDDETPNK